MKPAHRVFFLFLFLIFACAIPCVSAYTVTSLVTPPGYQPPGTRVTVSVTVDFSSAAADTFPQSGELQMSTDLAGPRWTPVLVLDGRETRFPEESGELLAVSGWYLSYPRGSHEQLKVTLSGTVPEHPSPRLNLVKVQEADAAHAILSTARIPFPDAAPVTAETTSPTPVKKTPTRKTFTPIPISATQESPPDIVTILLAVCAAGAVMATGRRD